LAEPATERFADALALAAHDLAEPLREVQGFAELLERRAAERLTPDDEVLLAHVLAGARRMRGLVDGLGAYVGAERARLGDEVVDLAGLAGEGVETGELAAVRGDRALLADMLGRLVDNARRFGGEGVRVTLAGRREGDRVVLEVADDGPGIREGDEQRLVRLFQRGHARDEYAGAGVGLTIAAAIAARHGGELALERRDGGGTVVRVVLPAA
jgi:signal transduction histidine kinase